MGTVLTCVLLLNVCADPGVAIADLNSSASKAQERDTISSAEEVARYRTEISLRLLEKPANPKGPIANGNTFPSETVLNNWLVAASLLLAAWDEPQTSLLWRSRSHATCHGKFQSCEEGPPALHVSPLWTPL